MRVKTDVLVVGGGIAGWFAADHARRQGADVVLVDKGYIGKAGQSPVASQFSVFRADLGDDLGEWLDTICKVGEYLVNRDWTELVLKDSYERFQDLLSWGIEFDCDEAGEPLRNPVRNSAIKTSAFQGSARKPISYKETFGCRARLHLERIGVTLMDRVTIVEPLRVGGRMSGAIGIGADTGEEYVLEAKATVFCTGGCGLKPAGYPCLVSSTGDGEGMAYRMGASLVGKEFIQPMHTSAELPGILGSRGLPPERAISPRNLKNAVFSGMWKQNDGGDFAAHGEKISPYPFAYLDPALEAHAGHGPFRSVLGDRPTQMVSGAALGMSVRKADGIWPEDLRCRTGVPGLYAAGDVLGTMQNGALYIHLGGSTTGCAVTGAIAGRNAAEEALQRTDFDVDSEELERARQAAFAPANQPGGYTPGWVTRLIRDIMTPYYVSQIKKADRLEAALTMISFIQEHMIPSLVAKDPHELRQAHETKNMALSVEVRLRSALFRTESRGMHYREDFPCRNDAEWLAWTKVGQTDGTMTLEKIAIPEEWRPGDDLTYRERYPYRFPGEGE